jgi:hypothetical protein
MINRRLSRRPRAERNWHTTAAVRWSPVNNDQADDRTPVSACPQNFPTARQ